MKHLSFVFFILLFISAVQVKAQFKKGTIMLGTTIGTTAYSSANSDYEYDNSSTRSTNTKSYNFSAGPQLGVFLTRNLVLGASVSLGVTNTDVKSTLNTTTGVSGSKTNTSNYTMAVGPYIRYYFANQYARNLFYGQVDGSVGSGFGNSSGNAYTTTTSSGSSGKMTDIFNWNTGASIGLTHFFERHIGMDVSLGYRYTSAKSDNNNATNTTKNSTGVISPSTNNYTLTTATNGITFGVGFHWFL